MEEKFLDNDLGWQRQSAGKLHAESVMAELWLAFSSLASLIILV